MKRLYIAAVLLAVVAGMCLPTHTTHRRRIDGAIATLARIESLYRADDTAAVRCACFAETAVSPCRFIDHKAGFKRKIGIRFPQINVDQHIYLDVRMYTAYTLCDFV